MHLNVLTVRQVNVNCLNQLNDKEDIGDNAGTLDCFFLFLLCSMLTVHKAQGLHNSPFFFCNIPLPHHHQVAKIPLKGK